MKTFRKALTALFTLALIFGSYAESSAVTIKVGKAKDATVKKAVKIGSFTNIDASQAIRVVFTQGAATGVAKVATTPSAEENLKVYVKDGTLKAYYDTKNTPQNTEINAYTIIAVTAPELREVEISGASSIQVEGNLKLKGKLKIDLSGSSHATFNDIDANEISFDLSGASKATLSGAQTTRISADISGASHLSIGSAAATTLDYDASGASGISTDSFKGNTLNADTSGASHISVGGIDAKSVKANASGASGISTDSFKGNTLNAYTSGASHISVGGIDAKSVKADASGASGIKLSGRCDRLFKEKSGASSVNVKDLMFSRLSEDD